MLSNATRGRFAEFIVGTAIGLDIKILREEWDAYDLLTNYGAKIEIKSAAYIQSWEQKGYSKCITFSEPPVIEVNTSDEEVITCMIKVLMTF